MDNGFFALLHRMRYINRWSLMRNTESENIQEHSLEVAMIAHALATVRRLYFAEGRVCPDPDRVTTLALFHDVPEIITGDLPTPVKYFSPTMAATYQTIEDAAVNYLLSLLPQDLQPVYGKLLRPDLSDPQLAAAAELVKAADRLSAYNKCVNELKAGNAEFRQAKESVEARLLEMALPEVSWWLENIAPTYQKSLDELGHGITLPSDFKENKSL